MFVLFGGGLGESLWPRPSPALSRRGEGDCAALPASGVARLRRVRVLIYQTE